MIHLMAYSAGGQRPRALREQVKTESGFANFGTAEGYG
jgi:hypothetical protein